MILTCVNHKILHVNLTTGKLWVEEPAEDFYRKYGGGSAMGVYYILKEMPARVDAFSPANVLTFFTGVPTGLKISGQSRLAVNAKSPLTEAIGDSQSGGFFPAKMKAAGFDGVVVRGRSPKPVYLWLHDGQAEVRDASHLWGKITPQVEDALKQELDDDKIEVAQIGPAGENRVRFAAIINMCNRANGRTGMGAVMGSKNLKAVVVQGEGKVTAADPRKVMQMFREGTKRIADTPAIQFMSEFGTTGDMSGQHASGGLPTYNYNYGQFPEGIAGITGELMNETILEKRDTCFACAVHCKPVVKTEFEGRAVLPRHGGPEYESMSTLGSYCGVGDMGAVALANQLCNQYGLDAISCGATVAFAMECFEKGILTAGDTGGLELRFGDGKALVQIVEDIALRRGFGAVLAEGSQRAAEKIGGGAEDCLITFKGQEAPAHMPQAKRTMGLIYAVNPFGADHMSHEHDPFYETTADELARARMAELGITGLQEPGSVTPEKGRYTFLTQRVYAAVDSFCLCDFVWGAGWQLYGAGEAAELIRAAAGWEDFTLEEFLQVGERRINLMRAFNAREGFGRARDAVPGKFFRPLLGDGPTAGIAYTPAEMEMLKDAYYTAAGWDLQSGNPTPEKLAELGIEGLHGRAGLPDS